LQHIITIIEIINLMLIIQST